VLVIYAQPMPGLQSGIGRGFDGISLESRAPVIDFHYNDQQRWSWPVTSKSYKVPDELFVTNNPEASWTEQNDIFRNLTSFINAQESWHKFGINLGFFSFSMGKKTKTVQKMFQDNNITLYMVERLFRLYTMESWPYFSLSGQDSNMFRRDVNQLPLQYDEQTYLRFVTMFGTHYCPQSGFGGTVTYFIAVNNTLFNKYSSTWVQTQVSLQVTIYDVSFGFNSGKTKATEKVDQVFTSNSHSETVYEGGTADAFAAGFKPWYKSVIQIPGLVNSRLVPLSQLVSNPTIRANLYKAIVKYLNTKPKQAIAP